MFKCDPRQGCGRQTAPGEKAYRVVRALRPQIYPARSNANRDGKDDPGGIGMEIAMSAVVCAKCAEGEVRA